MQKVENGKFVSVTYTGTLENGEVFDTSEGRLPLEFQTGAGQLIKGFENAVMGMSMNEKKEFHAGARRCLRYARRKTGTCFSPLRTS